MKTIDRVVLKTLIYHDIFDYSLKGWEIHKWLMNPLRQGGSASFLSRRSSGGEIKQKASLNEVEKSLKRLLKKGVVLQKNEYFFLSGRQKIVKQRLGKEKVAKSFLRKAYLVSQLFKAIPFIKLVGISGGLSRDNVRKTDDIDIFLITAKNRIWISRFLALILLEIFGNRRKYSDSPKMAAGKLCINLLLEEDRLDQENRNIYTAYEVLQMKVLWQRDEVYSKFLSDNDWVLNYLPNWVSQEKVTSNKLQVTSKKSKKQKTFVDVLENLAKKYQLKIMQKPKGLERVEEGRLYFHPINYQEKILKEFKEKCQIIMG